MSGSTPAPRMLRVSIVLWWIVAVVLLLQTGSMWLGRAELPGVLLRQGAVGAGAAQDRAEHLLLVNTLVAVVFAAAYLALGAALFRRRPWARIALSAVGVLHLLMLLGTGAVLSVNAVVLVIGAAAAVLLWRRPSGDWIAGEHD
ncbi:hypothetical protein IQ251_10565 [Saccharopolyspora sp. HNM0983]|uniref:Uncharacterized protein n=1 Tax=Saccharopolyspora montiporae TaxID=2781240 RepID=A0A929FZS7_9PSEU|nr:hypothetical protein [Saccharopolyspora sp. HNM0983]MBE9374885.1 hypothetical protein [Saccharopolyspora sp. HNM0983]